MKNIVKIVIATVAVALIFTACKKEGDLPLYKTGNGTVLSGSATSVTAAIADSSKTALTLNWTWPNYATDSAHQKFVVQIDSAGGNFAKPVTKTVLGELKTTLTAKELNMIVFGLGAHSSSPCSLDIRLLSSYANNNELYVSNTINVKVTPYLIPVTLAIDPVGPLTLLMTEASNNAFTSTWNATQFGNQVLNYAIQFQKSGGDWTAPIVKTAGTALTSSYTVTDLNRIALTSGIGANTTGTLELRVIAYQGTDFANPLYSNVVSLTVTTYLDEVKFWVVGGYNGWDNSDNALFLMNTPTSGAQAEGYVNFAATGAFKLTTDHSWDAAHTFGDDGTSTGKLKNPGDNINVSTAGYYLIKANPLTMTYSLLKTTWGIIGNATPGGWGTATPMTFDPATSLWTVYATLSKQSAPNDGLKFQANGNWDLNYGDTGPNGLLDFNGTNISVAAAGDYKVSLDLTHPNAYTFSMTTWGMIGDATPGGWSTDTPMTWDAANQVWTATVALVSSGGTKSFKFRANQGWDLNYGGKGTSDGSADNYTDATTAPLAAGGKNLGVPGSIDGTYIVTMDPKSLVAKVVKQ